MNPEPPEKKESPRKAPVEPVGFRKPRKKTASKGGKVMRPKIPRELLWATDIAVPVHLGSDRDEAPPEAIFLNENVTTVENIFLLLLAMFKHSVEFIQWEKVHGNYKGERLKDDLRDPGLDEIADRLYGYVAPALGLSGMLHAVSNRETVAFVADQISQMKDQRK